MMSIKHKESTLTTQSAGGVDLEAPAPHQYMGTMVCIMVISVSVSALFLIAAIIVAYCLSNRAAGAAAVSTANPPHPRRRREPGDGRVDIETGNDNVLKSCQKVTYAEAKQRDPRIAGSGCSVCLADYGDDDEVSLRLLPQCGHLFHERCVAPWLRLRPTCPLCRSSPAPGHMTHISTPLAEAVTLAL